MNFKWYIIHTLSGSENKVKRTIIENAEKKGISHLIADVFIPAVPTAEIKRGKQVTSEKSVLPGYLLLNIDLTDELWSLINSVPRVSGFLGAGSKPSPVSQKEVEKVMHKVSEIVNTADVGESYDIGNVVQVIDGAFDSFSGVVEEIDLKKGKLRVALSILGRITPIDLEFSQVRKLDASK